MSGEGAAPAPAVDAAGLSLGIAVARWHEQVTDALLARSLAAAQACWVPEPAVVRVAGAVELAVVVQQLAMDHDAVVALGTVIRGATPHFDYVAGHAASGTGAVAQQHGLPVINGVLTTDTIEQAIERAGTKAGNKGWDAAAAAIEMADLFARLDAEDAGA